MEYIEELLEKKTHSQMVVLHLLQNKRSLIDSLHVLSSQLNVEFGELLKVYDSEEFDDEDSIETKLYLEGIDVLYYTKSFILASLLIGRYCFKEEIYENEKFKNFWYSIENILNKRKPMLKSELSVLAADEIISFENELISSSNYATSEILNSIKGQKHNEEKEKDLSLFSNGLVNLLQNLISIKKYLYTRNERVVEKEYLISQTIYKMERIDKFYYNILPMYEHPNMILERFFYDENKTFISWISDKINELIKN
jgi:hypothetical protein